MTSNVIKHQRCPKCAELGRDRSKDNLAIYSDGHAYCFACGYHKASPNSLTNLQSRLQRLKNESTDSSRGISNKTFSSDSTYGQPYYPGIEVGIPNGKAKLWLHRYVALLRSGSSFGWQIYVDQTGEYVSFRLGSDSSERQYPSFYIRRYFGSNPKHPKWITTGSKTAATLFLLQHSSKHISCLCEDVLSSMAINNAGFGGIPIFGTSLAPELVGYFRRRPGSTVRIWLDPDKHLTAIKHAARLRQWIPDTATILSKKDPKEYSMEAIGELVSSSLKSISSCRSMEEVQ